MRVAVTSACTGAGIGSIMAFFMTTGIERDYQMAMAETGAMFGFALGLVLGSVAYYAIFRRRIDFLTFGTIVTLTIVSSASVAFLLHILTDTGGWLGWPVGVLTFIVACLRLRTAGVQPS